MKALRIRWPSVGNSSSGWTKAARRSDSTKTLRHLQSVGHGHCVKVTARWNKVAGWPKREPASPAPVSSLVEDRHQVFLLAIQRSTFASSTSSGTEPSFSTSAWNSRTSNFVAERRFRPFLAASWIFSSPIL